MPPDEKPPMPPQPTTKQLPAMTDRALLEDLRSVVKEGFSRVDGHLLEFGERLVRVEIRQKDLEDRVARHSGGTRQLSETDAKHDAAIANAITRLERVETAVQSIEAKTDRQTAILEKLESVAANPMVRRVAYAVGGAVLAYLTARGWLPK